MPWFRPQERTQAFRISSITGLDASSLEALGGSCLGGSRPCRGQGLDDGPAFDPVLLLDTSSRSHGLTFPRGHPGGSRRETPTPGAPLSHYEPHQAVRTHEQRLHPNRPAVIPDEQVRSHHTNKTTRLRACELARRRGRLQHFSCPIRPAAGWPPERAVWPLAWLAAPPMALRSTAAASAGGLFPVQATCWSGRMRMKCCP